MKYYIIAGEASGDLHASHLIAALRAEDPDAEFRGFGGDLMSAQGMVLVRHYRELAYMGFLDVALHAPTILGGLRQCKSDIVAWRPDVVILVDYPGFNMKIARYVHAWRDDAGRPLCHVFYYIAPKLWAWKEWRIKALRRDVDEVFSILPFEVEFFEGKHGMPIHYVGNPSVDEVTAYLSTAQHGHTIGRTQAVAVGASTPGAIAILCGSRVGEVRDNLWMMLAAAADYDDSYPIQIAAMSVIPRQVYEQGIAKAEAYVGRSIKAQLLFDTTYSVLAGATAALVTSGTATLETALFGVPQVVCYYKRHARLLAWVRRLVLNVPYVSLVNLIVGRELVRELILTQMTPEACRHELKAIMPCHADGSDSNRRAALLTGYSEMLRRLGEPGAPRHAAQLMVRLLNKDVSE